MPVTFKTPQAKTRRGEQGCSGGAALTKVKGLFPNKLTQFSEAEALLATLEVEAEALCAEDVAADDEAGALGEPFTEPEDKEEGDWGDWVDWEESEVDNEMDDEE